MKQSVVGILGCGDFLRWMAPDITRSHRVRVKTVFDPDTTRTQKWAQKLGAQAVETDRRIFDDPEIDTVYLFIPPFYRLAILECAAAHRKHILTAKPLGSNVEECGQMLESGRGLCTGVIYRRTGSALFETYRDLLESGEIGELALYKQDWLHHYPQWNSWATDPERNGGPFLDAMIHNLNIARYLMNRPTTFATYFSDNHAQALQCNDTEFLKVDFERGASAHLFITWAANLAVYGTEGNDREHIDQCFMVTNEGWLVRDDGKNIVATRNGETRHFSPSPLATTPFDAFAATVLDGVSLRRDIATFEEAFKDIQIVRNAEAQPGQRHTVK